MSLEKRLKQLEYDYDQTPKYVWHKHSKQFLESLHSFIPEQDYQKTKLEGGSWRREETQEEIENEKGFLAEHARQIAKQLKKI